MVIAREGIEPMGPQFEPWRSKPLDNKVTDALLAPYICKITYGDPHNKQYLNRQQSKWT